MSVRNDHELPRSQADVSDDASTALGLGYSEEPARSWVAALMAHLREQLELMSEPGAGDGRPRGHLLPPRLRRGISIPSKIMSWILRRSRNATSRNAS